MAGSSAARLYLQLTSTNLQILSRTLLSTASNLAINDGADYA